MRTNDEPFMYFGSIRLPAMSGSESESSAAAVEEWGMSEERQGDSYLVERRVHRLFFQSRIVDDYWKVFQEGKVPNAYVKDDLPCLPRRSPSSLLPFWLRISGGLFVVVFTITAWYSSTLWRFNRSVFYSRVIIFWRIDQKPIFGTGWFLPEGFSLLVVVLVSS